MRPSKDLLTEPNREAPELPGPRAARRQWHRAWGS